MIEGSDSDLTKSLGCSYLRLAQRAVWTMR